MTADKSPSRMETANLERLLAKGWTVPSPFSVDQCPVSWMAQLLPPDAISVADQLPALCEQVVGWLSAPHVCIWFTEAIVWRTSGWCGVAGEADEWWSGLPGSYIDLRRHRWHLSHWRPIERDHARGFGAAS